MIKSLRHRLSAPRSVVAVGAAAALLAGGVVAAPQASAQDIWATSSFAQGEGVEVDGDIDRTGEGSSEQCIGTGLAVGLPLLLLIPVGLASQLGLAGSSDMMAPLNTAIRDANTQLQNQLGLLDPAAAQAAEELNALLAPFGVTAGQAAIGVGMVAAGVAGTAALLDACGNDGSSASMWWWGENIPNSIIPSGSAEETTPAATETAEPTEGATEETEEPAATETEEPAADSDNGETTDSDEPTSDADTDENTEGETTSEDEPADAAA